jgi:hypothetical protein
MSEYSVLMEELMRELDMRGIEYERFIVDDERVHKEHVRFRTEGHEVSAIWGYVTTDNGGFGITYGWPGLLEAALFRYDDRYFGIVEDPEPMTVEEIVSRFIERR